MPAVSQHRVGWNRRVDMVLWIVTVLHHGDFKGIAVVHRRVDRLSIPPHVLVDTTAPEHWPRAAIVDRHLRREHTDSCGPLHENRIGGQQRVVFTNDRLKLIQKCLAASQPAGWQICRQTTDGDVAVRQTCTTGFLKQVEDLFTFAERVEKWAERSKVEAIRAHADQMAGDPTEL